ncbi:uncharacterized protein LOC124932614 [Impatiens glandulifera]|uniref:uncharacterized protein LOC124932614 n=1 Tax=Impatiens glandulifera TaxID=253017 RepID=UPI001FB0AF19|nr:uncharacterized protein LOC124932614 [Impatiens glandulifera]
MTLTRKQYHDQEEEEEHCPNGHRLELIMKKAPTNSFTCDGCKEMGSGPRYSCCDTCNYELHTECHKPCPTMKSHHFPPQHTFEFLRGPKSPCFCVACGKGISGFVYHCKDNPGLYLHPCCTNLNIVLKLPCMMIKDAAADADAAGADFFLQDDDAARYDDLASKPCFYCKKTEGFPGWSYVHFSGGTGGYRCHVYCSMQITRRQISMDTEKGQTGQCCTCSGGHQLKLTKAPMNIKNSKSYFKCDGCKEKGYGPSYGCDICKFYLHVECHQPSLTVQDNCLPGHTFDFLRHPPSPPAKSGPCSCRACGKSVLGFSYHCKESGWNLHPCCINLYPKINSSSSKSKIELFLRRNDDIAGRSKLTKACYWCKKTTLSETNEEVPGWSYVSKCGVHRYHVYCMMEKVPEIRCRRLLQIADRMSSKGNARTNNKRDDDDGEFWLSVLSNVLQLSTGLDPTSVLIDSLVDLII